MAKTIQGRLNAKGFRFSIVVSRFNDAVSARLLAGALDCLERHDAEDSKIEVVRVPGSFEIPLMAHRLARTGRCDALICLGALIRGETSHFDSLSTEVCRGLADVARSTGVPVALGILAADSMEQALERAGGKRGNRGSEAALSAIEMANLCRCLEKEA